MARTLVAGGAAARRVAVLPNYVDLQFIRRLDRDNDFRRRHGLQPSDFVVMYSGSIALKQGLETLVEAAARLRDVAGIVVLVIGEGPSRADLMREARERRLTNVRFLPLQPRDGLAAQLAAADALVLTQRRSVADILFPGKLLYYLAAGRPILAAVRPDGEVGRLIADEGVGVVVPPEEPQALADAVLSLRDGGSEARSMGDRARRLAESRFDRQVVLRRFADHLRAVALRARSAASALDS
jgi:colanic acid biosynthesis glycosyl transferase WcaI